MARLYNEARENDLWLDSKELKASKDQILSSIAMQVISAGMMAIEDYVKMCYCMSRDVLKIPATMAAPRRLNSMLQYFRQSTKTTKTDPEGLRTFKRVLHCLDEQDVQDAGFQFLSSDDKAIILRQHAQNARAVKHTYSYAVRVYETFRNAYNKHKHGHLFLFSMGSPYLASPPLDKLTPAIPYFARNDVSEAEPVFIGNLVLNRLVFLLLAGGGVFSLLRDLTLNVTTRCKYGGKKIIARVGLGPEVLSAAEKTRFEELVKEFDRRYLKDSGPKKLKLNISSNIKRADWDYFDQDWAMK